MEKTFTRRCKLLQLFLYSAFTALGIFYSYLVFPRGALAGNIVLTILSCLLIIATIGFNFWGICEIYRKITVNNSGITCKTCCKKVHYEWSEIIEFKKHEKGIGLWAGFRYYLSSNVTGKKVFMLADNNIKNLEQLIDIIFENAINAKFIKIENQAKFPFFKKVRKSRWAKKTPNKIINRSE